MRNGYISYQRRNKESGLENQCWKDSWNSIAFRDGSLAGLPRACCEIQGYAYDARMRCARLARTFWKDAALAAVSRSGGGTSRSGSTAISGCPSGFLRARARRRGRQVDR